ncbi:sigma-70 family RNA polymerase sigma factor [Permianibacter sp. IMCC34836]|uniref:RNA polymerase sigma factor n=1 Tax=Permianibacter fluminis TaxID=2738515 RepID=UPI0015518437|nr:sigma-70 family RNA polymerase sigma factor [Permianibacter fluminis]NQD35970.1 sigma-70 family RNA polymerase sigma factor [Permianibacter fluminis]
MLDEEELITLIARCALRDRKALKQLYDNTSAYMNAIAYRIVRSPELSSDVLQEAYLQIWRNAATYRPEQARALTWMSSIVRYRAIDRRDHEHVHNSRTIEWDAEIESSYVVDQATPEHLAINDQLRDQLVHCLEKLNERVKLSIQMAYLEGHSREEIASRFNTNANTVKSWLHRGADALKQCLDTTMAVYQ